jgi:rhodanese-related sulfurtransferase
MLSGFGLPHPMKADPPGSEVSLPTDIGVEEVERLVREERAQLVEVLPEREFEDEHLPGAVNLPLKKLTHEAADRLDRSRPVIVYCWDDA